MSDQPQTAKVYADSDFSDASPSAAPQSAPVGTVPGAKTYSDSDFADGSASSATNSPVAVPDKGLLGVYERAINSDASKTVPLTGWLAGLAQGAAKTADKAVLGTADLINQHFGTHLLQVPDETRKSLTVDNQPGQGTGGFLGDSLMFAIPAGVVGEALSGAPLAARLLAQAGVGAGVSAAQTSGNRAATVTGAIMGGAGEVIPAVVKGVASAARDVQPTLENFAKSLAATPTQKGVISETLPTLAREGVKPAGSVPEMASAIDAKLANTPVPPKALTVNNFARSFGATPEQKAVITKALPTLTRDGISPEETAPQMAASIKGKLADLGTQYSQLPADISSREIPADDVVSRLRKLQAQFVGGVKQVTETVPGLVDSQGNPVTRAKSVPLVTNANQPYYDKITKEIEDVKDFASANNGKVTFDNLRHMRDGANGRTNWQSAPADQNLYRDIGGVYRSSLDKIAPETTQLNRDYATYKGLDTVADKNVNMGRGADAKPDIWEGQENTPYAHYRALQDVAQKNLDEGRGTTQSGLSMLLHKAEGAGYGLSIGSELGHAAAGVPGAIVGGALGMYAAPKLAGPIVQALRNISDSGALTNASPGARRALQAAIQTGRSAVIQRAIKGIGMKSATGLADAVTTPAQ